MLLQTFIQNVLQEVSNASSNFPCVDSQISVQFELTVAPLELEDVSTIQVVDNSYAHKVKFTIWIHPTNK